MDLACASRRPSIITQVLTFHFNILPSLRLLVHSVLSNGPSLTWEDLGGMNGPLRCGKGTTWEGGQRVPSIARWPGTVDAGSHARQMTSSMDFFATALELAGIALPQREAESLPKLAFNDR